MGAGRKKHGRRVAERGRRASEEGSYGAQTAEKKTKRSTDRLTVRALDGDLCQEQLDQVFDSPRHSATGGMGSGARRPLSDLF